MADPTAPPRPDAHLPVRHRPSTLIASAARIHLGDRASIKANVARRREWQERCWEAYDGIGEIRYGVDYQSAVMSKLLLYVGVRDPAEPDAPPPPTTDTTAIAALDRLRSPSTGHSELLRLLSANLGVAGECYLHGDTPPDGVEEWNIRATGTLVTEGEDRVRLVEDPQAPANSGRLLEDGRDYTTRIWFGHPRYPKTPISPVSGILDPSEEVQLWGAASRSAAKSRLSAGILAVPDDLSIGSYDTREGEPADADPFMAALLEAMTAPVQDEESAASVVPIVIRGPQESLAAIRHIPLARSLDKDVQPRVEWGIRRLAQGLFLPAEVILGMASSSSHWGAWLVDEDAWSGHHEPFAIAMVGSLTVAYLTPALEAAGMSPAEASRYVIWFDPRRVIGRPNLSTNAMQAHDRGLISDRAGRDALGFEDDDAPSPEELAERAAQGRLGKGTSDPPAGQGDEDRGPPATAASALVAAASRDGASLGRKLAGIDTRLADRVQVAADDAVRRVLERVGSAVRSKAGRAHAGVLDGVASEQVAATLGAHVVAGLVDVPALTDGAYVPLLARVDGWLAGAQADAARLVPGLSDVQAQDLAVRQAGHRTDALAWFGQALHALTLDRVYDPSPSAPALGEWDPDATVGHDLIRETLARAGGAGTGDDRHLTAGLLTALTRLPLSALRLGVAVGETVLGELARAGLTPAVWTWQWGGSARPFPPHQALDGLIFAGEDDPAIANLDSFPSSPYYHPSDHTGCFPAGTVVSGPGARGATLRHYDGEMVRVRFQSGQFLTATPNHPVLTPHGWVGAGFLHEGCEVVRSGLGERVARLVPHDHQMPALIEEVADTFRVSRGVVTETVEVAPEHFHGDGVGSEVAVVSAYRELRRGRYFAGGKPLSQPPLAWGLGRQGALTATRDLLALRLGDLPTSGGLVRGAVDAGALLRVGAPGPGGVPGLAHAPDADARLAQPRGDGVTGDAVAVRECLDGLAGQVELDEVVEVVRYPFVGHVYNLHTNYGWYVADGILVHNCSCSWVPTFAG